MSRPGLPGLPGLQRLDHVGFTVPDLAQARHRAECLEWLVSFRLAADR